MLTGLTVFLILLLVLLALPVTVLYHVNVEQAVERQVKLQWLGGLVKLHLPGLPSDKKIVKRTTAKKRKKIASDRLLRFTLSSDRKLFWQRVVKFLRDLWRAIRKRETHLMIRIGLDDPADTGRIWALLWPVSQMLSDINDTTIAIEPVFDDATFQLKGSGIIRFFPLQLLYLVFGLLLSPAIWKGLKQISKVN